MRIPEGSVPRFSAIATAMAAIIDWRLGIVAVLAAGAAAGVAAGVAGAAVSDIFSRILQTLLVIMLRKMMQIRPTKTVPIPIRTTKALGMVVLSSFCRILLRIRSVFAQVKNITISTCAKIIDLYHKLMYISICVFKILDEILLDFCSLF